MSSPGKAGRWVLRVLLAVLVLSAVFSLAVVIFLHTDRGRDFGRTRLEKFVSANIPGKMRIDHISQLGPDMVVAENVRFYHPDGTLMLLAKHAEVVPDISMAFHGKLGFERAAVTGGFMLLTIDPDGRLGFEATMNKPPTPGEPHDPNGGLHYWMRSMHVQHFTTTFRMSKSQKFTLRDTLGFVGIRRIDTPGTQIILEKLSGKLEEEIVGTHLEVSQLDGWVHGEEKQVGHFDTNLRVGSNTGKLVMTIDYFNRPKTPLKISVHKTKGFEASALAWLLKAADTFTGKIEVDGDG
jgi:hypothetical protein